MRPSITSVLFCLLLSVRLYAASDNDERKSLESKAKALIEQGKALEKQDRLLDARDTYAEAQGIIETREGAKATYEVNQEIYKRVKKLMGEAKRTYSAGNYSEALESLSKAFAVQPENPSVSYNLALCYVKLKDRPKAVESLDSTIHSVSDPKEKEKLTELRDSLLSDESAVSLNQVDKEKVKELNALSISLENSSWRDTFTSSEEPPITGADPADPSSVPTANLVDAKPNDPSAAGKSESSVGSRENPQTALCHKLSELKESLPQSPAIYFNLARCAELAGKSEESIVYFNKYLQVAPNALDTKDVQLRVEDLTALTTINGQKGPEIRKLYADASRNLDLGKYDRALQDYIQADSLIPTFPQTKRRLGLMFEMLGNTDRAKEYFSAYKELAQTAADKADADRHLSELNRKKEEYGASIDKATKILAELLDRWVGIDSEGKETNNKTSGSGYRRPVSPEYAQHQLELALKELQTAQGAFPLAPEGNELMGVALLLGQNGHAAERHFDAVVSQKLPLYFFASVTDTKDKKNSYLAKCELDHDTLRLIHLANYDAKGKQYKAPLKPAGQDHLGNLATSEPGGPSEFEGISLKTVDLKKVETRYSWVVIKLADRDLWLFPLNLTGITPVQGPPARKFANAYTRLYRDYLGIEDAKLGKESMTSGEKVQIGLAFAGMAMGAAGAAGAMGGAFGMMSASLMNTSALLMQTSTVYMQKTTQEEREMLQMNDYKLIPTESFQLTFREDLR